MALPVRNSRIRLPQGQMFWREVGGGTTIVFLHSSWSDGNEWLPVIERLSFDYHCLAPDLLGFGESDRPRMHYSIEAEVECLAEYLEFLKLKRVCLVGQGIGGWVAATYALKHADQVEALVLLGAEGVSVRGGDRRWQQERWLTRVPLTGWILRSLSPLFKLFRQQEKIKQLQQLQQKLKRSPAACQLLFKRRKAEIQAELLKDRLNWLKLPTLILQGEEDDSTTAALNRAYANAPQAELRLLPGTNLAYQAPKQVAAHIREFLHQIKDLSSQPPRVKSYEQS